MSKTPLDFALAYAALGWKVLPCFAIDPDTGRCTCGTDCKHPGKHPIASLVPRGHDQATSDPEMIRHWWGRVPNANIGVALAQSGLVAIDIDPRNGGWDTIDEIERQHGPLVSDVLALTGGGGEHRVFALSAEMHVSLPGKLGPGVDVKRNGYIMVEPSTHISGKRYEWEASSDPLEGIVPSPLPDWLRDLAHRRSEADYPRDVPQQPLADKDRQELQSALAAIPANDHDTWIRVGMALHSTGAGYEAFELWDAWSRTCPEKYNQVDQYRRWRSFRHRGLDGVTKATIFHMAQERGWTNPAAVQAVPQSAVRLSAPPPEVQAPPGLLSPPGIVGEMAQWVEATARKPQPQFSVQAAIAFCCTVLGRRYVTDQRNWPSLYLMNIGKSASGKEHAKWAIERALDACGLAHLIGPASYTSDSGLLSTLLRQPSHITVIDEFGKVLEDASVKNGSRAASTVRALMEVWGRCDGTMRPQGYSTFGLSERDIEKLAERSVRNPALTLLAMTTPETLFETIGMAAVRDGFLNRFLIVETDIGRQPSRSVVPAPVPERIVEWAARVREREHIADPDSNPTMEPTPTIVPIDPQANALFEQFDLECLALMDQHDRDGLAEMFGRTREIAMRLALVVAVGCDSTHVRAEHAQWAIDYVRYYAQKTVERLRASIGDSEFDALKKQVYDIIWRAGARGCTVRDIAKASRKFARIDKREQTNVLESLQYIGEISLVSMKQDNGHTRTAWVAVDAEE